MIKNNLILFVIKFIGEAYIFSLILVVMGGFALVNNNKIIILVNEAEFGSVWFVIFYIYEYFYNKNYLYFYWRLKNYYFYELK